jgi:hypothetical protein
MHAMDYNLLKGYVLDMAFSLIPLKCRIQHIIAAMKDTERSLIYETAIPRRCKDCYRFLFLP